MTCFWDGVISILYRENKEVKQHDIKGFIKLLKNNNKETRNVRWNNTEILTEKNYKENMKWIENIDENAINHGYDCSICDPVLLLICEIFKINIIHNYNGYNIKYKYNSDENIKTYRVQSNHNHFWV